MGFCRLSALRVYINDGIKRERERELLGISIGVSTVDET